MTLATRFLHGLALLCAFACIQACGGSSNPESGPGVGSGGAVTPGGGGAGGVTTPGGGGVGASSIVGAGGVGGAAGVSAAGGGSGGTGSTSAGKDDVIASPSAIEAACQTVCDQSVRCGGVGGTDCLAKCHRFLVYSHVSQQAIDIFRACSGDSACIDSDTCDQQLIDRDPSITPMLKQCYDYMNSCRVYSDYAYCEDTVFMIAETRAQVVSCTRSSCGDTMDASCFVF